MRFTCFIDACSYIYLTQHDGYYNGKTLLHLLSERVTLRFSNEVYNEIARHTNERMPESKKRMSSVYKLNKSGVKTYVEYEQRLFDTASLSGEADRGEKHNLIGIIDHYLHESSRSLVFLSDDRKAIKNVIGEALTSFPVYHVWNSFDVILFLYLETREFTFDYAKAALRDMNAFIATTNTVQTREKIVQDRIAVFKEYSRRLERISKVMTKHQRN